MRSTNEEAARAGRSILARMAATQSKSKGPTFAEEFGARLRGIREKRGLTQQQLADALRIHRPTITQYESGSVFPEGERLAKLASVLEVSLDELILGKASEQPDEVRDTRLRAVVRELEQLRDRELVNIIVKVAGALITQAQQAALMDRLTPNRKG